MTWGDEGEHEDNEDGGSRRYRDELRCFATGVAASNRADCREPSLRRLNSAWRVLLTTLKERKHSGFPIRCFTLSVRELEGDSDDLTVQDVDEEYLRKAEVLVEKVFDWRGWDHDQRSAKTHSGRLLQYIRQI